MQINGFHCPKCGQELHMRPGFKNVLAGICHQCDLMVTCRGYADWIQEMDARRARMQHYRRNGVPLPHRCVNPEPELPKEEKKISKVFNPSER